MSKKTITLEELQDFLKKAEEALKPFADSDAIEVEFYMNQVDVTFENETYRLEAIESD